MIDVPNWVILNFFTIFLLVLLLLFQNQTSRLQKGRKYSYILICTIVLLLSESIGRIGEAYPEKYLALGRWGYYFIFLLDPLDILFAVYYMDCWMDDGKRRSRAVLRGAFELFAILNGILVTYSVVFRLNWFFYFEDGIYHRGDYFLVRAAFLMIFICLLFVYAIAFKSCLMSEYKNTILFLPGFAFLGALLQVFLANLDTTYAGISLGCLILFFFYQSRDVNVDYLTGVLNRRGLDIRMQEKVKSSISSGSDFYAIMMDIDNFKEINDKLGHDAGDKAIKTVASILEDTFGADAAIGRFGGDEFCVIIDGLPRRVVTEKIDNVHGAIANYRKRYGWPNNVDISCGFQNYDHSSGMTAPQFQKLIDGLMYEEKQEHHKNDRLF